MDFPFEFISTSAGDTERIGTALSEIIMEDTDFPRFIAMYGELGVGKTAFVRGFCKELCPKAIVKSPTFALVNEYRCNDNIQNVKKICHFDMYRITDEDDLYSIGYDDYLRDDYICIVEWSEQIQYALPSERIEVSIKKTDKENERIITIKLVL